MVTTSPAGRTPHGAVRYPRISLGGSNGTGGLKQRIVLPDQRTRGYDLGVSIRGTVDTVTVALTTLEGDVLAETDVGATEEWTRHEPTLELAGRSGDQYTGGAVATELDALRPHAGRRVKSSLPQTYSRESPSALGAVRLHLPRRGVPASGAVERHTRDGQRFDCHRGGSVLDVDRRFGGCDTFRCLESVLLVHLGSGEHRH